MDGKEKLNKKTIAALETRTAKGRGTEVEASARLRRCFGGQGNHFARTKVSSSSMAIKATRRDVHHIVQRAPRYTRYVIIESQRACTQRHAEPIEVLPCFSVVTEFME